jgi:hypothetical protein
VTRVPHLTAGQWAVLAVAAVFVGFAKTAIGGAGSIAIAIFALVLPARESTGALLPLLIAGDVVAVSIYRRHANWGLLWRLMPWVLIGIVLGVALLARVDNAQMRPTIGVVLLAVLGVQLVTRGGRLRERLTPGDGARTRSQRVAAGIAGVVAGFTTMVANAGGAAMTVYLLLSGQTVLEFMGTASWFFFIVNLAKLPFSGALGLVSGSSILMDAALVPAVLVGAAAGAALIRRIGQLHFEQAATVMAALSALLLLL